MKRVLVVVAIVVAALVLVVLGVAGYFGAFHTVTLEEEDFGPVWLVYEKHVGDYRGIRAPMVRVYRRLLDDEGIESSIGFGLYWDNPREVPTEELRSIGGCIVEDLGEETLARILARFEAAEFPMTKAIVARFPLKGPLSILVAIVKVYPRIEELMRARNLPQVPIMEVYDRKGRTMTFVVAHAVSPHRFESFLGEPGSDEEKAADSEQ